MTYIAIAGLLSFLLAVLGFISFILGLVWGASLLHLQVSITVAIIATVLVWLLSIIDKAQKK